MAKIMVEENTETRTFMVIGESKAGEFVISGPWQTAQLAEAHAQRIIGLMNEAVFEVVELAKAKRPLILG